MRREPVGKAYFIVSIHAFRGEGDGARARGAVGVAVSIHAFRGEGDRSLAAY